jgi:hypothetical protein
MKFSPHYGGYVNIENQWPAFDFHKNVEAATLEDCAVLRMTPEAVRAAYLEVWLALTLPAGNA